jgi:hypothetical protein
MRFLIRLVPLLFLVLLPDPKPRHLQDQSPAVFVCNIGKTNFYLEQYCTKLSGTSCAPDLCEFHRCAYGTCRGYLYDCVAPAYACIFHGCLQCPNCP